MSNNSSKVWLIAYDIASSSRLQRVQKRIRKLAIFIQFSVYATRGRSDKILAVLEDLRDCIDDTADDIRAYHIPRACMVWTLGRCTMADGIFLQDEEVVKLLTRNEDSSDSFVVSPQNVANQDTDNQQSDFFVVP